MKYLIEKFVVFVFCSLVLSCNISGQKTENNNKEEKIEKNNDTLSLLFLGDIMQHQLQVESAYYSESGKYDFSTQFKYLAPYFKKTDVVVGNLETTFSGEPYSGYPQFSSPNQLAFDIKNSGINYLVTSNNHVYDKGKPGFEKTLKLLDSVGFKRTGTFLNEADKKKNHPMIIEKKGLKIAIFNYTYGVNGDLGQAPSIINKISKTEIMLDLEKAKSSHFDAIIVFLHWGTEYKRIQDSKQTELAEFCFESGANIVIAAHPHVIQPMKFYDYTMKSGEKKQALVAYSLGNFVSNYATRRYSDGGAMIQFKLTKNTENKLQILNPEYQLIWVFRPIRKGVLRTYYVLPISEYENSTMVKGEFKTLMDTFIKDSRELYNKENLNVPEYKFKK